MIEIIKKYYSYKILFAALLIIFAVVGRLVPHAWNATPLIAVSLFAGVYLGRVYAITIPVIAMIISDMFIGFYNPAVMFAVYGSFMLVGVIGFVLRKHRGVISVIGMSLASSTLFFLITNSAVWAFSPFYPTGLTGLVGSLVAGIPFYKTMLIGDMMHVGVLFGGYSVTVYVYTVLKKKVLVGV